MSEQSGENSYLPDKQKQQIPAYQMNTEHHLRACLSKVAFSKAFLTPTATEVATVKIKLNKTLLSQSLQVLHRNPYYNLLEDTTIPNIAEQYEKSHQK